MFRTANPTLNRPEFQDSGYPAAQSWDDLQSNADTGDFSHEDPRSTATHTRPNHMTVMGTANKTLFLIALTVTTAVVGWNLSLNPQTELVNGNELTLYKLSGYAMPMMIGGALLGFLAVLVTMFKPKIAPVTAPLYALIEGFFVGAISALFATVFGGSTNDYADGAMPVNAGLVLNAALLTMSIAAALCGAYAFKIVRPGKLFYSATIVGTMGVCLFGLVAFLGAMFTGGSGFFGSLISVYDPNNGGVVSVGFSLLLVALASANLVLDYDQVNIGVKNRAPKYMEWFGGMTILVTLIWLYVEILRLLAKLRSSE